MKTLIRVAACAVTLQAVAGAQADTYPPKSITTP
jgi:hypothetical protein